MAPRTAQEASRGTEKSQIDFQEAKITIFEKVVFAQDCLHFFALEPPQDGPKRLREPQKSVQREF